MSVCCSLEMSTRTLNTAKQVTCDKHRYVDIHIHIQRQMHTHTYKDDTTHTYKDRYIHYLYAFELLYVGDRVVPECCSV